MKKWDQFYILSPSGSLLGKPTLHMIVSVFPPHSISSQSKHKTPIKQMKHTHKKTQTNIVSLCLPLTHCLSHTHTHTHLERNPALGSDGWGKELCGCGWNGTNDRKTSEWENKKTSGRQDRAIEMARYGEKKTRRGRDEWKRQRTDDSNI